MVRDTTPSNGWALPQPWMIIVMMINGNDDDDDDDDDNHDQERPPDYSLTPVDRRYFDMIWQEGRFKDQVASPSSLS